MIKICIKGCKRDALDAATKRNIQVEFQEETRFNETILLSSEDENYDKVTKWFCEKQETIENYGYPSGTCLWYGYSNKMENEYV